MHNKNPWAKGFAVGKATHSEVKKTKQELEAQREKKRKLADIDEKKFLESLGVYS